MNERLVRGTLVGLLFFNAVAMILGALLVVPNLPTDYIVWGPFTDYTVPAVALGLLGVLSLGAAAVVVAIPALGALIAILAGLGTTLFEIVEVMVVGIAVLDAPELWQAWLQPFFFSYGLVVAALGFWLYRSNAVPRAAPTPATRSRSRA